VAVSEASQTRAQQLQGALRDHDAAMSLATEAFEAAFNEADELSGGTFNENSDPDAEPSAETQGETAPAAAQTS
jgi:hypothetical protein